MRACVHGRVLVQDQSMLIMRYFRSCYYCVALLLQSMLPHTHALSLSLLSRSSCSYRAFHCNCFSFLFCFCFIFEYFHCRTSSSSDCEGLEQLCVTFDFMIYKYFIGIEREGGREREAGVKRAGQQKCVKQFENCTTQACKTRWKNRVSSPISLGAICVTHRPPPRPRCKPYPHPPLLLAIHSPNKCSVLLVVAFLMQAN